MEPLAKAHFRRADKFEPLYFVKLHFRVDHDDVPLVLVFEMVNISLVYLLIRVFLF